MANHPGRNLRLRIAVESDAGAILRLINAAFEVERFFLDADRITMEEVRSRFRTGHFILAEENDASAGCVYIEPRNGRAYIGLLSVDPGRQGSGIGKTLMAGAEDHCRALGCRFVDLRVVNLRKELPPFYRGLGYVENGTAPFPEESNPRLPCHFIIMTKVLPVTLPEIP